MKYYVQYQEILLAFGMRCAVAKAGPYFSIQNVFSGHDFFLHQSPR